MDARVFAIEARTADWIAHHAWPFMRPWVRSHLTRRCRLCVLPETCVPLDADGVCPVCHETRRAPKRAGARDGNRVRQDLDRILTEAQGCVAGPHDALLLFSGGKDSTYMLYRVLKDYPRLRVRTLLVDNGFMSPFALANVRRVLARFDVEHLTLQLRPSLVTKVFHFALTHLELQKGYSIVDLLDGQMSFDAARNCAAAQGIPLILCGLSGVQVEQVYGPVGCEIPSELERTAFHSMSGIDLRGFLSAEELRCFWDGSSWAAQRVPRFVLPMAAWDLDEQFVQREVGRLGLLDARHTSPLLTNHMLIPVIAMAEVARFGYSSFEVEFARMVREGRSVRTDWINLFEMLEYATRTGRFVGRTATHTLARLNLTPADLGIGQPRPGSWHVRPKDAGDA